MEQTGTFEGKIVGAGTKLRTEHSNAGGNATVISTHGAGLIVKGTRKWVCEVADATKNWKVGDTWIYVTVIAGATIAGGWMAVTHWGAAIVTLTVDLPDSVTPPDVPPDQTVVNSITYDYNAAGELLTVWVNNEPWRRYYEPPIPPVGVSEGSEG